MLPCSSPVTMFPPVNGEGRYLMAPLGAALGSAPVQRPCGCCICCLLNRKSEWSLRMVLEAHTHDFAYFGTFTYGPEFLPSPMVKDERTGVATPRPGSLWPPDLAAFVKRLRTTVGRRFDGARMRFSGCGEYGEEGRRPHYHLMMFMGSTMLPDLVPWRRSDSGAMLYRSPLVEAAWGKGFVELGAVTEASCDYVAKYAVKRVTGDRAADFLRRSDPATGESWQVLPEFTRHSTHPGIGAPFFQRWRGDVVQENGRWKLVMPGGVHRTVPGYFMRLLKRNSARVAAGLSPIPGLEGCEGIEDVVAMRGEREAWQRERVALASVSGDREKLAAMRESDRKRIAEYRSYLLNDWKETL